MTLGVIADTHIYAYSAREVPPQVVSLFQRAGVGLIIHLGDINTEWVLQDLVKIAPVLAVVGNNDEDALQDALPKRIRFTVGKHTFGAIHGHGGRSAKDHVKQSFGGKVDVAFFGHSHIPFIDEYKGTTLFNPGSATDRRWHQHFGVGVVRITDEGIDPELILYANPAHLDNISFEEPQQALEPQAKANS